MNDIKKKYAFISYSHKDEHIAKWLQRKLESYKLPSEIHNEYEDSRYLRPIFRDKTDLTVGVLSNEIRDNLYHSKYLIVICSPNSAQSTWVNSEVKTFIEWGRLENIILFAIEGDFDGELDYRPICLREHILSNPKHELLAVDIRQSGKQQAYIRVVARMLGLEFDILWQRHLRERRKRAIFSSMLIICLLLLYYWFSIPIRLQVNLNNPCRQLPKSPSGVLQIGDKTHLLSSYDTTITEVLPGYWRLQEIPICIDASFYDSSDTLLKIRPFSLVNTCDMILKRDDTFRYFAGKVINHDFEPISGIVVEIGTFNSITDNNGEFSIEIPIEEQSIYKSITLIRNNNVVFSRAEESPSRNLIYMLTD